MPDTPKSDLPKLGDPLLPDSLGDDAVTGTSTLSQAGGGTLGDAPLRADAAHVAHDHRTRDHDHGHHDSGPFPAQENAPYAYSLISWGSVIAGAVIAVTIGGMLSLAGLTLGATVLDPADAGSAASVGVGAGLWLALSTVIGMLIGGYVAARSAHNPDHHEGALHGASVWAVGFMLAFFLTGSFASNAAFTGVQAAGQAAEAVTPRAAGQATDAARGAADAVTPETAEEVEAVDTARAATSAAAFWAFITMLASGMAAITGGHFGAKHDEHMHRPRRRMSDVF